MVSRSQAVGGAFLLAAMVIIALLISANSQSVSNTTTQNTTNTTGQTTNVTTQITTVQEMHTINATKFVNNIALQGVYSYPLGIGSFTIVPLPITEPNISYGVVCNTEDTLHFAVSISAKTTTTFTVNYPNALAGTTVSCLVFHA